MSDVDSDIDSDVDSDVDVVVIGAGQAGLAVGYHLHRLNRRADASSPPVSFVLLDRRDGPGGAWRDGWPSLRLFSPAAYSSLPGWPMPPWDGDGDPPARHVRSYLAAYEDRYDLPVRRPVQVTSVRKVGPGFLVETGAGTWTARAVVSATGTWDQPYWPYLAGSTEFAGLQLHAADYDGPERLAGRRVAVVGGANSGAQVATDLLDHARVTWVTRRAPRYLPDEVDGRALFEHATARVRQARTADAAEPDVPLGDVVAVPAVRRARDAGRLVREPMPHHLDHDGLVWASGERRAVDAIIWCTGFRPALRHLRGLGLSRREGRASTRPGEPTRSADHDGLFLVGYGDWTGPASATLIGVGATARRTAELVQEWVIARDRPR